MTVASDVLNKKPGDGNSLNYWGGGKKCGGGKMAEPLCSSQFLIPGRAVQHQSPASHSCPEEQLAECALQTQSSLVPFCLRTDWMPHRAPESSDPAGLGHSESLCRGGGRSWLKQLKTGLG